MRSKRDPRPPSLRLLPSAPAGEWRWTVGRHDGLAWCGWQWWPAAPPTPDAPPAAPAVRQIA